MNEIKKKFIFMLAFALMFLIVIEVGFFQFAAKHELAHQAIFKYAGVKSTVSYDLFGGMTVPDGNYPNAQAAQQANELHAINEIVSYNGIVFTSMICMTIFISALYLGISRRSN